MKFHLSITIRHFLILILMDLDIYTFHLLDAGFQWFRVMIMIITLHIHLTSNPVLMAVWFEDSRINSGLSSNHVIIYGHNMRNGAMFGKLKSYENSSFYNGSGNNVFYIYTGNVIKQYKIFSCYISEAVSDTYTFNFPSLASMQS